MSKYEVVLPVAKPPETPRFYTGDETGALYFKLGTCPPRYVCLIPGKDGPAVGAIENTGGFTPVAPGALINITV